MTYTLSIPELAEAVAACTPTPDHAVLLKVLRRFPELEGARLTAVRGQDGGTSLVRRKVLDAKGHLVHDEHEAWLREQLANDGGDAVATYRRLRGKGYLLSRCGLTTLYLVHDRGGKETAFTQAVVYIEDERIDCQLLDQHPFRLPHDLYDLTHMQGEMLPEEARARVRPLAYRLQGVVDVDAFVSLIAEQEAEAIALFRKKTYSMSVEGAPQRIVKAEEAFPGWDAAPRRAHRIFSDWAASSAGRSGARLCEHWVLETRDHTDAKGQRFMSYIPAWATTLKLAKVEGNKGSAYELFGKLEKLDRRVGVPFAWYFFMLHGNRVDDAAARRVIAAAEQGQIVLPEHDYRILKAWEGHPYGF